MTLDELKTELIQKYPVTKIAKMYNVSDKAIWKLCKKYNINLGKRRGYWTKFAGGR